MYDDKIVWYLNTDNFSSCTYQFFTRVVGCSNVNTSYDTLDELNSYPLSKSQQEFPVYSVEFNEEGRLVLSVDFYAGRFVPTSIALISLDANGSPFMIAKIITDGAQGSSLVSASVSRIFDIPIPKFKVGDTYAYPSFETVYKRKSGTPIGEEKVMIGEHHHAVQTNGVNDTYPSLYSGQDNFILSAQNYLPSKITESVSHVYGERGTLSEDYTDLLGVRTKQNSINITDRNISSEVMADILADVLEVIIMANNKIQILGKNIPIYDKTIPVSNEKQYILMTDKINQSNDRKLEAIDTEKLKSWIIDKHTVSSENASCTLNSTITVIKSQYNFELTPNGGRKLAIVFNTKAVPSKQGENFCDKDSLDDNDITVKVGNSSYKIHASSVGYFYCNEALSWEFYSDTFAYNSLVNILNGDYKFESLDIKGKVKSKDLEVTNYQKVSSFEATNLTVNETSKLNTITKLNDIVDGITLSNSKLKFGGSYISSDSSASFGKSDSTTKTAINANGEITTVNLDSTNSKLTYIEQRNNSGITLKTGSVLNFGTSKISSDGSASFIGGKTKVNTSGVLSTDKLEAKSALFNTIEELTTDQGITLNKLLKFKDSYISGTDGSASFIGGKTTIDSLGVLKADNSEVGSSKFNSIEELTPSSGITLNSKLKFGTSNINSDGSASFLDSNITIGSTGLSANSITTPSANVGTLNSNNENINISLGKSISFGTSEINTEGSIKFNRDSKGNYPQFISKDGKITTSEVSSNTVKVDSLKPKSDKADVILSTGKLKFGSSFLDPSNGSAAFIGVKDEDKVTRYSLTIGNSSVTPRVSVDNSGKIKAKDLEATSSILANTISATTSVSSTNGEISAKTISASSSVSTDSLKSKTASGNVVLNSNLSLGTSGSYINTDGSAKFGVSTLGTTGFTTTANITAPGILSSGSKGITFSSTGVSLSGKLEGSSSDAELKSLKVTGKIESDSFSTGTLSATNLEASGYVKVGAGRITNTDGANFSFLVHDTSAWSNIKTSGVYIQ